MIEKMRTGASSTWDCGGRTLFIFWIYFFCFCTGKYTPQYVWLTGFLPTIDRTITPWVIVLLHSPWYNSNTYHYLEGETMRVQFESFLNQYSVDIVFAGHVHAYERSVSFLLVLINFCRGPVWILEWGSGPCSNVFSLWLHVLLRQRINLFLEVLKVKDDLVSSLDQSVLKWIWKNTPSAVRSRTIFYKPWKSVFPLNRGL